MPEPREAPSFKKSVGREYLESIVVAVILALFIRTFAVQAFKIPTGSMKENLLIGDHLLVNKLVYSPSFGPLEDRIMGKRPIRRGDVVVFKFPEDPTRDFIKRVIGLPGETIEVRNKQVFVDGRLLPEDVKLCTDEPGGRVSCQDEGPPRGTPYTVYFREAPLKPDDPEFGLRGDSIKDNWGPQTVPEGQLLVLGDNRDNSRDSRFWGFLPEDQVKGRALLVYWSYDARDDEYRPSGWTEWLKDTFSALARTRWKRFFHVIR